MPTTDPIVITPSTSVVLVNTADFSGNPIVLLPNVDSLGRIITIRDADGGSDINPIYISTTGGALFQQEISTVTISSFIIDQPYGFYTITPRLTDIGGTTRYGVMNAYAFREATDFAFVNMFNANVNYLSTVSTVNLGVTQDLGVTGNVNIAGSVNVGGSINYVNPGAVSFSANDVNATTISTNTIKSATIYGSTLYASSIYLANTLEASTMRLSSRPIFDLNNSSTWTAGGFDPNSMTLGDPENYAGAQVGTGTNFFGLRSFSKLGLNNYSTNVVLRDGNLGLNVDYTGLGYNSGNPNYNLNVKGAARLSNYDARAVQSNTALLVDGLAGSSNRYVNSFAGSPSQYQLFTPTTYTQGFYQGTTEHKWITAESPASIYPETLTFYTSNGTPRVSITSNGNVGIGTTSPAAAVRLDVSGGQVRQNGPTSNIPIVLGAGNGSGNASVDIGKNRVGNGSAYVDLTSENGQASYNARLVRNSGANGTLDLIQQGTGVFNYTANSINHVTIDSSGQIVKTSLSLADGSLTQPSLNFRQGSGSDENTGLYHPAADTIGVVTAGVERVRVDSAGNVGIGKTPSTYQLEVSGNVLITSAENNGLHVANSVSDARIYLEPKNGGGSGVIKRYDGLSGSFDILNYGGGQINLTANNANYNGISILSNGTIGIGTASPAYNLDVSGLAAVRNQLLLDEGSAAAPALNFGVGAYTGTTTGLFQPAANSLGFATAGSERARIDANGFIGIGTTTPDTWLDVYGDSSLGIARLTQFTTATTTANPVLRLQNNESATSHQLNFHTNMGAGNYNSIVQANDKGIIFNEGPVNAGKFVIAPWSSSGGGLRMDNSGNVAIGKPTPQQALDVSGSIQTSASILVPSGTAGAPTMTFTNDNDTGIYNSGTNELSLTTAGTQRVIVNSSGNMGIGVSPSYRLDVNGTVNVANGTVRLPAGSAAAPSLNFGGASDGDTGIFQNGAGIFSIATDGVQRSYITSDQQRMYFTSPSEYTLFNPTSITVGNNRTVNNSAELNLVTDNTYPSYGLRLYRGSGSTGASELTHRGTGNLAINTSEAAPILFQTQGLERMRIDSTGNVGIGAAAGSYKLDVNGSTRFRSDVYVGPDTTNGFIRMTVDSGISYIQSSSNTSGTHNKLYFTGYAGSSNTMVLDIPNRRVGIGGQTAPTVALDVTGDIKASGNITAYSDERFKTNIHPIVNALEKVGQMRGVTYETKEEGRRRIGVIAQEIEKIIPEVVLTDDTEDHYKSVDYGNIVAVLIEAVKELKAKVDELSSA